jgi:23S rRNA G2069 N7-methylase RlmK/C1962 C5-methylase RlmI
MSKAQSISETLTTAFTWRVSLRVFESTETLRIFYGPGESSHAALKHIAIDLFKDCIWITAWEIISPAGLDEIQKFLRAQKILPLTIRSIVFMDRSKVASEADVKLLWGEQIPTRFEVKEFQVPYLIQFHETKHPGLFLDHAPLREWLLKTQKNKNVLNLFSYTGSLSVASGFAGAARVTTLDLSKSTIEWAQENWKNAKLAEDTGNFIYGDVFEWLPRLLKKGEQYDTILSDPPSFSRTKGGTFSTQKDLKKLHELIFPLLKKGGVLVTSINSENITEGHYLREVQAAAEACACEVQVLRRVDLPETFPTSGKNISERYLKGFYLLKS